MKKKKKKNWLDTFTKLAVLVIITNAVAWVWCSYGLAYLGRFEIAESLSQTAIDVILGFFIAYAVKSGVENVNKHGIKMSPTIKSGTSKTNIRRDY